MAHACDLAPLTPQLAGPVAGAILLAGIGAAQYGYLPVRSRQVSNKLEDLRHRWYLQRARPHRYRRHADVDDLIDRVLHADVVDRFVQVGVWTDNVKCLSLECLLTVEHGPTAGLIAGSGHGASV